MNLFRKALIASAIASTFTVNAAVVDADKVKISKEGYEALVANATPGTTPGIDADIAVDIAVSSSHPSRSEMTLTFTDVDLTAVAASFTGPGTVDNTTTEDQGSVGNITFLYGNGIFTFDKVVVDATAGTILFEVYLGNNIAADSAFRVEIDGVELEGGSATVSYASIRPDGSAIESSNTENLSELESQLTYKLKEGFDGIIDRSDDEVFTDSGKTDTLTLTVSDNGANLAAPLTDVVFSAELEGLFTGLNLGMFSTSNCASVVVSDGGSGVTGNGATGGLDTITCQYTSATTSGTEEDVDLVYVGTTAIPETGDISLTLNITANDDNGNAAEIDAVLDGVAAGEWETDATTIDIAYFPVGGTTSSFVHFANSSAADVEIQVEGYDSDSATAGFDATDLMKGDEVIVLKANAITKVPAASIIDAFDLDSAVTTKLALTFKLSSLTDDEIKAQAITTSDVGRTELATSQQLNQTP